MIEVYPHLYLGSAFDYETRVKNHDGWAVVQACREPYYLEAIKHNHLLANTNDLESLMIRKENRLILNLQDVSVASEISSYLVDSALRFIDENLIAEHKVMVHCQMGMSRSAGIVFLFMAMRGCFAMQNLMQAQAEFKFIYPNYAPSSGMLEYIRVNWDKYHKSN